MARVINKIVIHCSATRPVPTIGAAWIDREHRKRGFSKIGYHYVIKTSGEIEEGRNVEEIGAHVSGHNKDSIGICLVGGISATGKAENNYTKDQWESLYDLVDTLTKAYPTAEVLGHRDLSPDKDGDGIIERFEFIKECPCFDVRKWWETEKGPE